MVKILTVFFFLLVLRVRPMTAEETTTEKVETTTEKVPKLGQFAGGSEIFVHHFLNRHLHNMTQSFCKDAMYKLRMAHQIQMGYRVSRGYELGIVASNIMEKYRHLIIIYRYFSNPKKFRNTDHSIEQILNGYSNMQGEYNQLLAETVMYHEVLERHAKKDEDNLAEAKALAKQYGVSVNAIRNMQRKGIEISDLGIFRRSMQMETKLPVNIGELPEVKNDIPIHLQLEDPKNINIWTPKKQNFSQEEEYKKKLRYAMWAEGWKGYDGDIEGVHIDNSIAMLGFSNDSDFLLKELKGVV